MAGNRAMMAMAHHSQAPLQHSGRATLAPYHNLGITWQHDRELELVLLQRGRRRLETSSTTQPLTFLSFLHAMVYEKEKREIKAC